MAFGSKCSHAGCTVGAADATGAAKAGCTIIAKDKICAIGAANAGFAIRDAIYAIVAAKTGSKSVQQMQVAQLVIAICMMILLTRLKKNQLCGVGVIEIVFWWRGVRERKFFFYQTFVSGNMVCEVMVT